MAEEKNKRKKKRKEARLRKWALVRTEVLQALLTRQHGQDRNKRNNNINNDRSSTANTAARARPPGVITDSVRATSTSRRGPQWTRPMTAMPGPHQRPFAKAGFFSLLFPFVFFFRHAPRLLTATAPAASDTFCQGTNQFGDSVNEQWGEHTGQSTRKSAFHQKDLLGLVACLASIQGP